MLATIKNKIKKMLLAVKLGSFFLSDYIFYIKHNIDSDYSSDCQLARIMLTMHQLEKGMSFTDSKREFGGDKAFALVSMIRKYISICGKDKVCDVAINVLYEYLQRDNSTRNENVRAAIKKLCSEYQSVINEGYAGIKTVVEPPLFDNRVIENFFATRSSVREYSVEPITEKEISSALRIASFTPTACNRQTSRVYHINDKAQMTALIDNQLGNQGWCNNAQSCFVVTVNECYFGGGYERNQGFIDGGLYAMNFVWGLHLNHIATCFKMFVREPKREELFKKIAKIPENEIPIVLILAGHYKSISVVSPKSVRIDFMENRI